jgi:hypothetical protein
MFTNNSNQGTKAMAKTTERRLPRSYTKGDRVHDIYTGEVFTVKRSYWQYYAGGSTSDYTVLLESTKTQATPWNKSTNLAPE